MKPARLGKCNANEVLEKQLTITGKQMLFLILLVFLFFMISILIVPQTFGYL